MPITVKHTKVSTIPDDTNTDLVRPSDWNADHTLVGLGTMAEQNANAVAITGGTATLTSVTTPVVQATNSAGLALRNSAGTTQMSMGAGGGDNITVSVPIAITPANALVNISPTGTGTVTINPTASGTINNITIGATTAAAGSFTNLTTTNAPTFGAALPVASGGTGVTSFTAGYIPYGNGTSALGSSANLFWDSANSRLGLGTSTPNARLVVQQANNTGDGIRLFANGTDTQLITRYLASTDTWQITASYASSGAYKAITWFTSDLERIRLHASGGVSIGNTTDAGAGNLNVNGTVKTGGYTVATLPTGVTGARTYVTNALAPSYGATVVGGGAVTIPVFYNGTNWIVA
jgi:hypothetical protein